MREQKPLRVEHAEHECAENERECAAVATANIVARSPKQQHRSSSGKRSTAARPRRDGYSRWLEVSLELELLPQRAEG